MHSYSIASQLKIPEQTAVKIQLGRAKSVLGCHSGTLFLGSHELAERQSYGYSVHQCQGCVLFVSILCLVWINLLQKDLHAPHLCQYQ